MSGLLDTIFSVSCACKGKVAAVQKMDMLPDFAEITPTARIQTAAHGWRAKCLQRLVRLDLPVPETVALPAATVRAIAAGHPVDVEAILAHFGADALISVRPSPENPDWGGPGTILNIGMNAERHRGWWSGTVRRRRMRSICGCAILCHPCGAAGPRHVRCCRPIGRGAARCAAGL
jgi:hypothetical protein